MPKVKEQMDWKVGRVLWKKNLRVVRCSTTKGKGKDDKFLRTYTGGMIALVADVSQTSNKANKIADRARVEAKNDAAPQSA
jgi:hypothetical protein